MISKFHYKNFEPDFAMRMIAERALERMEDGAPYASTVIGVIEAVDEGFRVNVDIYSRFGLFSASAREPQFEEALRSLEEKMCSKLDAWKRNRFSSMPGKIPMPMRKDKEWSASA